MRPRFYLGAVLLLLANACLDRSAAPARALPATLTVVTSPAASASVGSVAGTIKVRVAGANAAALSGVVVTFTISAGTGTLSRSIDTSRSDGTAETLYTLGTASAANEVTAMVNGIAPLKFAVTSIVGPPAKLTLSARSIRMNVGRNSSTLGAVAGDEFGNNTGVPIAWVARDPTLVSATRGPNNNVSITVLRRPGQTYAVGTSGTASDSILVAVPDTSAPCAFSAAPVTLAVGGAVASDNGAACIHAAGDGEEYIAVTHYNTALTHLTSFGFNLSGNGIDAPVSPFPAIAQADDGSAAVPPGDLSFELALRRREFDQMSARAPAARAWYQSRPAALSKPIREGDIVPLNVNAFDFCNNPDLRYARVVAITQGAVILADTANPTGGFTDAEYREFGVTMDTLVNPVDTAAFGAPSDIDGNGRVGILFTRAVNELTPRSSASGIVLGFYYSRDLLPRVSAAGDCAGSNVSEMFYILVPDPNGVASGVRTKAFVQGVAMATVGHEYQHLINASRRMYVNEAPRVSEEPWLNEGLSHIAEELLFYRASGRQPRENIDASALAAGSVTRAMFDVYQKNNFARYREFLRNPETNSPLAEDDVLATRGASWSFLRYLADRTRATDGDFWHRLVNSRLTGAPNLDEALEGTGVTTVSALRDWSVSVVADDIASGAAAPYQQPSWNFVTAFPAIGLSYALAPRDLRDMLSVGVTLQSGGSDYHRFILPQSRDGHVDLTGNGGQPAAPGLRLTIVRIR